MRIAFTITLMTLLSPAFGVEIIGHRGASFDAPENTLASVELSWKQQADGTEIDVYLSKDGEIVVLHDKDTKRTAGKAGLVHEMTVAELQQLDVGSWKSPKFANERIPTLQQVLKTIPQGKRLFIEVKCGPEIAEKLDAVLQANKRPKEETVIISFNSDVIAAMEKRRPDLVSYWIVSLNTSKVKPKAPTAASLIKKAKEIGADGLDLSANASVLDAEYAKAILDAKLKLCVWTVNDVELAKKMIAVGVEGITTDRPGWLREQLQK
ncbi:MAG: glycerophosphodiester phosphodiesterase [Zavarzinella sp.]